MTSEKISLNANQLKIIAIIAMTLDHFLWVFFPGYDTPAAVFLLHAIGRITAPIMCFFIAEGYHHTKDIKKYIIRLFIFAVISHFAYCFAFGIPFRPFTTGVLNQTSVIWALAWGLVALAICKTDIKYIAKVISVIVIALIALPADWSSIAVLIIVGFGCNRGNFKKQSLNLIFYTAIYAAVFAAFIDVPYGILQMAVVLSLPLLYIYNGERGKHKNIKWFFYLYYPGHLIAVGIMRIIINGNIGIIVGGKM